MLIPITIFLTPDPDRPGEARVAAFPDSVRLVINVIIEDDGSTTIDEVDSVFWQYSKVPPLGSNLPPFDRAPEPIDIIPKVIFPPENSPFGASPTSGSTSSLLPEADTASFENIGINPLIPNEPRADAAPEPPESFGLTNSEPVDGPERKYEYAIILTSRTSVNTADPDLIIIRRHKRRSTV